MLIILDRDGVINTYEDGDYICRPEDWIPLPGSIEAIARLSRAGHQVAVATNQSGVARGFYTEQTLAVMHDRLRELVHRSGGHIDHIAWCPHMPDEGCDCRKPGIGLLVQIQKALGLDSLAGSWLVGDSRTDLEAGIKVGCRLALVRTGNGRITEEGLSTSPLGTVGVFNSLSEFAQAILQRNG